ncbi:hypothetical protein GMDG_08816 [Pseudogymnoascus destructans 20631-21]|uniref:Uncharacterized protein n=1 Tax=Pseudogymnoascus destructans (strain ATCC MYA-4855 / 20631-21) TaxID=658429 RepID=L8FNA4_PSED2|nr:hypothetical protein GMDG_08816 [Pseudogymnoascus destructans 20631-21]
MILLVLIPRDHASLANCLLELGEDAVMFWSPIQTNSQLPVNNLALLIFHCPRLRDDSSLEFLAQVCSSRNIRLQEGDSREKPFQIPGFNRYRPITECCDFVSRWPQSMSGAGMAKDADIRTAKSSLLRV